MSDVKLNQFVIFNIGRETYALNTSHIVRIENDKKVRYIPNANKDIKGIITVEEDIVPLVDLRTKFQIVSDKNDIIPFIIVCKMKEEEIVVGFIVDEVIEVIEIPEDAKLSNINDVITGSSTEYIEGIYRPEEEKDKGDQNNEDLLIILNVNKLLNLNNNNNPEEVNNEDN